MAVIHELPAVKAFLDLIAQSEGTSTNPVSKNQGYDVIVTGVSGPNTFTDYTKHPFADGRKPIVVRNSNPPLLSTASGRYQFIVETWDQLAKDFQLPNFSSIEQDFAAVQILKNCNAYDEILTNNIQTAIWRVSHIWASFPGNLFGQNPHTENFLLRTYATILDAQTKS